MPGRPCDIILGIDAMLARDAGGVRLFTTPESAETQLFLAQTEKSFLKPRLWLDPAELGSRAEAVPPLASRDTALLVRQRWQNAMPHLPYHRHGKNIAGICHIHGCALTPRQQLWLRLLGGAGCDARHAGLLPLALAGLARTPTGWQFLLTALPTSGWRFMALRDNQLLWSRLLRSDTSALQPQDWQGVDQFLPRLGWSALLPTPLTVMGAAEPDIPPALNAATALAAPDTATLLGQINEAPFAPCRLKLPGHLAEARDARRWTLAAASSAAALLLLALGISVQAAELQKTRVHYAGLMAAPPSPAKDMPASWRREVMQEGDAGAFGKLLEDLQRALPEDARLNSLDYRQAGQRLRLGLALPDDSETEELGQKLARGGGWILKESREHGGNGDFTFDLAKP